MQIVFEGVEGNGEIYLDVLRAICGDVSGKSMIDIGCFHAPYTPQLGFQERCYIDIQDRPLDFKEEQKYFIQADILDFLRSANDVHYDVAIASDVIEHLTMIEGIQLMGLLETKAKKAIVFSPLGPLCVTNVDHPDSHKSGWTPDQFVCWASVCFPDFHKSMNAGAFFCWRVADIYSDFERVKQELNNKSWAKQTK